MSVTRKDIIEQLLKVQTAKETLSGFCRTVMEIEPAKHHMVICDHIDRLLNDEFDELIINTPPGAAKSTYTSIALPTYFLGRNPRGQVLGVSYSTELAEKWGRKVRNLISDNSYQKVFEIGLSQDSKSAGRWATDQGGEYYAAGAGSGILGFRSDLTIIDDPISGFEEAQSLTRLEKLQGWYETDLVTRMKPNAKLVLICQRLARNDLAGYLIDRNRANPTRRQKLLVLPMEAVEDLDILGRMTGDRLWPEWFTKEMVEDAKRDEYKWKTLYQQQPPSEEGSWVSPSELRFIDVVPALHEMKTYLLTDLALSVNTGDYSVHVVIGVDTDLNIYIIDAWRGRVSPEVTVDRHLSFVRTYSPAESLIDDDNAAKVYVQLLAQAARSTHTSVPWKMLPMRGQNKETRAAPLRGWFKRGKVFIKTAEWNSWLKTELLAFPNAMGSGVDDGVDALSLIGRRLASMAVPKGDSAPPVQQKTVQQMTLNELFEFNEQKRGAWGRRI
jgi:predicted phage terminase large subunit-like protein